MDKKGGIMIASHDSLTFMKARFRVMEVFAFMWRTQKKSIEEQREAGVSHLDIRIRREAYSGLKPWATTKKRGNYRWRVCHGLVDFDLAFGSIAEIAEAFGDFSLRIILERGDAKDFDREVKGFPFAETYRNIKFLGIKKGWKVLLNREVAGVDHCFTPFLSSCGLIGNLKRIWRMMREDPGQLSISGWARRHPLPDGAAHDSGRLYFADMI